MSESFLQILFFFSVISNQEDTEFEKITIDKEAPSKEVPASKSAKERKVRNKYSKYYFVVGSSVVEGWSYSYVPVAIVEKEFWAENECLDDQPQEIEEELLNLRIESPNETSDFHAISYNIEDVCRLLEDMGLEYSNEVAEFLNQNAGFDTVPALIR